MSSFSAVLDACVLYPAALRDTLLRCAEKGLYRAHWTAIILEEMSRNLIADGRVDAERARRLQDHIKVSFPEACVRDYEPLVDAMANHPKDRHVLAAAVRCHAQVIVTCNLGDFPDDALRPYGLEAQHPDDFLCDLLDLDRDAIAQVLEEQAADLHSPRRSASDLLTGLEKLAPVFVDAVRGL